MKFNYKLINEEDKIRLDKFLTTLLKQEGISRTKIQQWIKDEALSVNDEIITTPNFILHNNMIVRVNYEENETVQFEAEDIDFEILYEDDYLFVINKPNNLVVHPGNGNESGTLVNGLIKKFEQLSLIGGTSRPGIVHRIDKQTTGLLIVAKDDKTHVKLSTMLANHEIYKEYLVLVWGTFNEKRGRIDAPIGRNPNDRKKMMVTSKNAKQAITNFEVLQTFDETSLLKCSIETGRTHQIRVHFQFIKHPVINDPIYGLGKEKVTDYGQYLHAHKLRFIHPILNREIEVIADLPSEFYDKIKKLGG